jgi:two-component system, response regulator FlrC
LRAAQQEKTPTGHLIGFVGRTVAEVERDLIIETLKFCLGNRMPTAGVLGISIRAPRNKLNDYAAAGVAMPPSNGEPRAVA